MWAKGAFLKLALSGTQIKILRLREVALKLYRETPHTKPPPCHEFVSKPYGDHPIGLTFLRYPTACGQLVAAPKHPTQHKQVRTSAPTIGFGVAGSVSMLAMP